MDVRQNLFIERLHRFRIPNVPAVTSVSVTRGPVIVNLDSHLREVRYVRSEESALLYIQGSR